jgi:MFS transporter, CP family, cyanate transporter
MNPRPPEQNAATSAAPYFTALALLWLAGVGLRITILAVPPVIPLIKDDLAMSATQIGILSGLPQVLFAAAAVPGSLLIARFGALPTLIFGLLATALGSALRGAALNVLLLYAATIVTGFGVAVMHPSLPPLVRAWLPTHIGFGTAVFTNGLIVGEIIPIALTMPAVMPLVGHSWRLSFVAWAMPIVLIALILLALAPHGALGAKPATPQRWWPDWRSPLIWRLGLMFGSVNAMYFASNAFIPIYLADAGRAEFIGPALVALNIGQLPASFALLPFADRLVGRRSPYLVCAVLCLAAVLGMMFGNGWVIVASATLLGAAAAGVLILIFALPPLLSAPDDVHRTTAGMMTISYSCSVIIPIISGGVWDLTGVPMTAFVPIALCTLLLAAASATLRIPRHD